MQKNSINTKKLVSVSLLTAMAYMLVFIFHIVPMPTLLGFLSYDPKDIILIFIGLLYGPLSGLASTIVVCLIEMVTVSDTGPIGLIMNFISSSAMVLIPAYIFKTKRVFSRLVIGLVAGTLVMTALMLLWNYLITPLYMGYPREAVKDMLLPLFLPFNLAKGAINCILVALIYKPLSSVLVKARLMPKPETQSDRKSDFVFGIVLGVVFIIVTAVYYFIVKF